MKDPILPPDDDDFSGHDYAAARASVRRQVELWQHAEELRRWVDTVSMLWAGDAVL